MNTTPDHGQIFPAPSLPPIPKFGQIWLFRSRDDAMAPQYFKGEVVSVTLIVEAEPGDNVVVMGKNPVVGRLE